MKEIGSLNELLASYYKRLSDIERDLYDLKKEAKKYKKAWKRADSDAAKDSIEQENIEPLYSKIAKYKARQTRIKMECLAIESSVLEEEIDTRKSGSKTITKIDDKYKLKFIFSRLRRFGNFTGYLSGRKEEIDNTIKNYLLGRMVNKFIKDTGKEVLYEEYDIDPDSKNSYNELMQAVISDGQIDLNILDEAFEDFKNTVLDEQTVHGTDDRREMLINVLKHTPKKAPETPYLDSIEDGREEIGEDEQER